MKPLRLILPITLFILSGVFALVVYNQQKEITTLRHDLKTFLALYNEERIDCYNKSVEIYNLKNLCHLNSNNLKKKFKDYDQR